MQTGSIREEIIDRIKKMRKLAEKGIGGESISAKSLIDKLARKYDIDVNSICSEVRKFNIKTSGWRLSLIIQLCAVICGVDNFQVTKSGKGICCIECEESQWLEIIARFKILEKDYKEQLGLFYEAFIVCNGLTLKSEKGNNKNITDQDISKARKVQKMANGLSKSKSPMKKQNEMRLIC